MLKENAKSKDRSVQGLTDRELLSATLAGVDVHAAVAHIQSEVAGKLPFGASRGCNVDVRPRAESSSVAVNKNSPLSAKLATIAVADQWVPDPE